jgi:hypothetical protein
VNATVPADMNACCGTAASSSDFWIRRAGQADPGPARPRTAPKRLPGPAAAEPSTQ